MSFEHIILVYIIPVLIWVAVISITLRLLVKKQAVSATLSWLMIIYLVPLIGVIAYLIFGEIKLGTRRAKAFQLLKPKYTQWLQQLSKQKDLVTHSQDPRYHALFKLVHQRLGIPNIRGNELHILDTPESIIRSIIRDIQQARHSINMVFYIWSNDGMINEVKQALEEAVQRGVKVCLLLDSVGSNAFLKSPICKEMRERGIEITEALHVNLFRMFFNRIDLRQHRKIIVIDNQIAYTGSMNMVDPNFFKQESNVGNWVDVMVRINGPVSPILSILHAWDWEIETTEELPLLLPNCPIVEIDDNDTHSVPSHNIAEALRIAAFRGVDITLILPKRNDSLMVRWASRTFFDDLLEAGVKIYHFEAGLLHTKSILIDNKLALVGTVNMDLRSFLLNFEITIAVEDRNFANEVATLHENYLANSSELNMQEWLNRPFYHRIIERLFFLFSPLL